MEKIYAAPDRHLRVALVALCDDDARLETKLVELLGKLAAKTDEVEKVHGGGGGGGKPSLKRKAELDIRVCVRCKEPFSVEDNRDGKPCRYHPGNLDVDSDGDFWADHDEDCHGTIDTDEMREEYPEGFVWDCCDWSGTSGGCTGGRHHAADEKFRRMHGVDGAEDPHADSDSEPESVEGSESESRP